jgi:hypothetical protein
MPRGFISCVLSVLSGEKMVGRGRGLGKGSTRHNKTPVDHLVTIGQVH